jgi:alpha-L-fucosidase
VIGKHANDKEWQKSYYASYQNFNPTNFNADEWMEMMQRAGMKYFSFTSKHHEGFCMWPTKTLQKGFRKKADGTFEEVIDHYSIAETPFKRDIVGELVKSGRAHGLGVSLYYSHIDWHDWDFGWDRQWVPNFWYDGTFTKKSDDPERWAAFIRKERDQITELLTQYGPIDTLCLDMNWCKEAQEDANGVARMARQLQPNILLRNRGIGDYGDYETPEGTIPEDPNQVKRPWQVIYPCGGGFSYHKNGPFQTREWILESLIDIVAKGGNFQAGFGPGPDGKWQQETIDRISYIGDWLKVNGECIFTTRPYLRYHEGKDLRFTRSKDKKYVYLISLKWPGETLQTRLVKAKQGSAIRMLGLDQDLKWRLEGENLVIDLPKELQDEADRPCRQAYAFKVESDAWEKIADPPPGKANADFKVFLNDDFSKSMAGQTPQGWTVTTPNKAIAPVFQVVDAPGGGNGGKALMATGTGRQECFGFIEHPVKLSGRNYHFKVRFKVEGIEDINRNLVHGIFGTFNDGIFHYRKESDGWIVGENRFRGEEGDCKVRLTFRFSPNGKVWWDRILLEECAPIPERRVKIAASWGAHDMNFWSKWLDAAGQKQVAVALMTEGFNGKGIGQPEPIDGPTGQLMSGKAKQWKMYVAGTFYEQRGDLVFNSCPLYDPAGKLVGIYEKVELYDPELDQGCTPGSEMKVFKTAFGKVGIMTCYDSWHAETARLLAYKGAELILFPNAGYCMGLMPARAADNGVWIAAASGGTAGIWDSGGALAGNPNADPSRYCASSILEYAKDDANCMISATVDLSRQYSPHNWGGPMASAPGGRRVRQTVMSHLEDELATESKRWWDESD